MTCYHPLKGFPVGKTANGKTAYKITSYDVDYVYRQLGNEVWRCGNGIAPSLPNYVVVYNFVEIPCGKCIGCRLKYSRDWADRCMLEAKKYDENYFVTLTYSEENVPMSDYFDEDTGELSHMNTLRKRDFQLFMKRLRKKYGDGIRFFSAGEYGSTTFRPHYHAILFNIHFDDLELMYERDGYRYYKSESLNKVWKNGFCIVSTCTWETCAYVARYVCKKRSDDDTDRYLDDFYQRYGLEKEFVLMSRRPGIARDFFDSNKEDIYKYDELFVSTSKGSQKRKPPRYFDKLFEELYPDEFAFVKANRKNVAELHKNLKMKETSLSYTDMLKSEEENKLSSIRQLKRDKV